MRGVISTPENDVEKLVAKARAIPKMDGTDLAKEVTTKRRTSGMKGALARADRSAWVGRTLRERTKWSPTTTGSSTTFCGGWWATCCHVTVVPAQTSAEDVLALKPDGVFCRMGRAIPSR